MKTEKRFGEPAFAGATIQLNVSCTFTDQRFLC
jgi:hypothetical protein